MGGITETMGTLTAKHSELGEKLKEFNMNMVEKIEAEAQKTNEHVDNTLNTEGGHASASLSEIPKAAQGEEEKEEKEERDDKQDDKQYGEQDDKQDEKQDDKQADKQDDDKQNEKHDEQASNDGNVDSKEDK